MITVGDAMVKSDYGGAFAYPTGPPPKCAQTLEKEFVDPDCPLITGPASPLVIPCYVVLGCLGLFVTLHLLHRLIATRRLGPLNRLTSVLVPARATVSRASRADGAGDPHDDTAYGLDFSDGLTVQGYRSTWLGTAALWSVGLYVVILLYCYLVIIVDVYHKCQWNGFWNSQCFSGDWPVFGALHPMWPHTLAHHQRAEQGTAHRAQARTTATRTPSGSCGSSSSPRAV